MIKICKGCDHIDIVPIEPPALACCPDSNYVELDTPMTRLISKLELDTSGDRVNKILAQFLLEEKEAKMKDYMDGYDEGLYDKENK